MMDVGDVPICLRPGYIDGRKTIDGLMGIIQEQMKMDVLQGGLFIFCSKAKTTIRCILWDGTGFWNIQKKLVGYTFAWPRTEGEVMKVTSPRGSSLSKGMASACPSSAS
jgi:transposase